MNMIQIFTALPGWHPWYDGLWNGKSSSASAGEKVYECYKHFILWWNDSLWKHRSCNTYNTYNILTYSDMKELRPMILIHSLACPGSGLPSSACALGLLPVTLDTPMNRKFMPDADQWADSDISPHFCQLLFAQVHLDPPGGGGANHGGLVEGEGETGKWITGDPHFFFEPYNIMIFVNFFRWRSIPGVELPAFQLHKSLELTTTFFLRNRIGNNDASWYLWNFFWMYFVQEI